MAVLHAFQVVPQCDGAVLNSVSIVYKYGLEIIHSKRKQRVYSCTLCLNFGLIIFLFQNIMSTSRCQTYEDQDDILLSWKAFSSLPFFISTMLILLSFSSNRGICQRVDVGELSHPAMHKRLFRLGNAVDDEAKVTA